MSDDPNLPALKDMLTDFTDKDDAAIEKYTNEGMPGLAKIDEVKFKIATELYLSGKTYGQIAMILAVDKPTILFLSKKYQWFTKRQDYLVDLEMSIRSRLMEAKIVNQDFLMQMQQAWQKKFGNHMNEYLRTGDITHMSKIDLKEVSAYLKVCDMIQRLSADPKSDVKPLIGLNMGDGATITKTGDNSIEITPKARAVDDVLKQFADMKRQEEKEALEAREVKKQ